MSSDIPQGYLPPDDAYVQATEFTLANDPLVNDAASYGINGWFSKIGGVLKRGWRTFLPIFIITRFIPTLILTAAAGGGTIALFRSTDLYTQPLAPGNQTPAPNVPEPGFLAGALGLILLLALFGLLLQMVGYGAATYAATRQAAGHTVRWGEAMRYGLRRCGGLAGWYVVTALTLGFAFFLVAFCLLSTLYVIGFLILIPLIAYAALATAMVGPAYLFERRNPIGRSFGLFHGAPGRMTGRLLLVALALFVPAGFQQGVSAIPGSLPNQGVAIAVLIFAALLSAAIDVPVGMVTFSGILATYAERRGDEGSLTPNLVDEL